MSHKHDDSPDGGGPTHAEGRAAGLEEALAAMNAAQWEAGAQGYSGEPKRSDMLRLITRIRALKAKP